MDISIVIKKTTAYALVTTGITFTYVLVVLAFELLLRSIWGYYSFWAAVPAALVIAVTFVPLREQLQKVTDRIFFHRMIEYQDAIREVTRMVASVTDLRTLFRLIDRTIIRIMCIKNAAILLLEEKENNYVVEKTNGLPETILGLTFSLNDPLFIYLSEKKDAVVLEEIKSLMASDLTSSKEKERLKTIAERLQNLEAQVAVPSFVKGKLVGVLTLGEKLSGELYSPDDLELLLTMASEAGVAIENAKLYRDITETRDYLNNLIQGSVDAIVTMDMEGRVLSWNEGAEAMSGYKASEVVGQLPPRFNEEEIKLFIGKVLNGESVKAVEFNKVNKNGVEVPILMTLSPVRNADGKIIAASAVIKDITELKRVDQLKKEFLSVVSHELRTPLTPIKGYLALLLGGQLGKLDPKQSDALKVILGQSNHLHDLIDTVIDISRMEAGKPLELEKEPVFIDKVIKESIEAMASAFSTKGIKVEMKGAAEHFSLLADRKKLMRVMANLLWNALKFTPDGGVVEVLVERLDKQIKVAVADTGIGLAPQHLEKVFDRFYQVDTSYTRATGGIGMGLTIAKEIIEAHGGTIWAESQGLGMGSKFYFTIPVLAPASHGQPW